MDGIRPLGIRRHGIDYMNWEAISAVGELLSALAVLATLVYLAVQVRQSKELLDRGHRLALSQVYQARADARSHNHRLLAEGTRIPTLYAAETGEEEDQLRLRSYYLCQIVHHDNVLYQHELGLVDENVFQATLGLVRDMYPRWQKSDLVGGKPFTTRIDNCYNSTEG